MRRDRGGTRWENLFLSSWAANGATKKREREGLGLGLERAPLAKPTQQPTKNSTSDGADIKEEIWPRRNVGGERLPVDFYGYSSDEK
jgi:hypothetical protein